MTDHTLIDEDWPDPPDAEEDARMHWVNVQDVTILTFWIDPNMDHPDPPPALLEAVKRTCHLLGTDDHIAGVLKVLKRDFGVDDNPAHYGWDFYVSLGRQSILVQGRIDVAGSLPIGVLKHLAEALKVTIGDMLSTPTADIQSTFLEAWVS